MTKAMKTLLLCSTVFGLAGCPNEAPAPDAATAKPAPVAAPTVWSDAPLTLSASIDYRTGEQRIGERTTALPVTFTVPSSIYVRTGNAGNGQATLQYRTDAGVATCLYRGAATVSHPTTDLERARGERYRFVGCDNGQLAEQPATSTWAALKIVSGDSEDPSGVTSTEVHMGGGCSEPLRAPLGSDEVVIMRDSFSWDTMPKLPETDVEGHPALFHGLIYVDSKNQTAALDRMRIYWSAQPISQRYMAGLRGKCGRVEHATDGRGVVVYALFPAKAFNIMRDFGIQAMRANVAPPFKFIIPSPPDQPEYVNTDGSIKYTALASAGFGKWLATRASQQPSIWDPRDWPDDISDAAEDAYDWTKDNIVKPAIDAGETAWDYASKGFDAAIDFAVNATDDLWEQTQQVLGDILKIFADEVHLNLKVTMVNRDPAFPAYDKTKPDTAMVRLWGPANADGTRPQLVPAGAHVRVRQWGFGFVPVMDQNQLGENGEVSLTALKGADGREGDLCVEMDTDYARITSDFIPNEVCNFAVNTFGNFDRDWDYRRSGDDAAKLVISQADLFALTQIKDSADYYTKVIGASPFQFEVLTGSIANRMTKSIAGSYRAMTLCLDFPGTGASLITATAQTIAAAGFIAGPVVGAITSAIAAIGTSLIEKDLWWPDAASEQEARDSRGVMTHEYGHFAMCSLLYSQGGPGGLTGLLGRVFEGQDDSRDDEIALMTEGWADTFAMQVVGGSNYIPTPSGTPSSEGVSFCTKSPCMDYNYRGLGEYSGDAFHDELAKFESLLHDAFDRADAAQRFSYSPANGDALQYATPGGPLEIAPTGYLKNGDENVSLSGGAWKTWVRHWLERGRPAVKNTVIGGLVQTMKDEHHSWCDICELLALHDGKTAKTAFDADPTGKVMTFDQRFSRWTTCNASSDIKTWLGAAPATNLSMDGQCRPCPLHNFVDSNGVCQPCPAGSVANGNQCSPCEYGASKTNEMCIIG